MGIIASPPKPFWRLLRQPADSWCQYEIQPITPQRLFSMLCRSGLRRDAPTFQEYSRPSLGESCQTNLLIASCKRQAAFTFADGVFSFRENNHRMFIPLIFYMNFNVEFCICDFSFSDFMDYSHNSYVIKLMILFLGITLRYDLYGATDIGMAATGEIMDAYNAKRCERYLQIHHS